MGKTDPRVARGGRSSLVILLSALLCAILVVVVLRMRGERAEAAEAAAPAQKQGDAVAIESGSSSTRMPIAVPQEQAATTAVDNVEPAKEPPPPEAAVTPDPEKELAAQLRSLEDYKAMSIEELEAEGARLDKLFSGVIVPVHQKLLEQGYGIYLGPFPIRSDAFPSHYMDQLTALHTIGGDVVYVTVIDPVEHADLYKVNKTIALLRDIANEKRFPR